MRPLAHSARPEKDVPVQPYDEHIINVTQRAVGNARKAAAFLEKGGDSFVEIVNAAALFHDLGKLDFENQDVMKQSSKKKLPVNHVDAGTAELLRLNWLESALLVYSHHHGLPSLNRETARGEELLFRDQDISERTDKNLSVYLAEHAQWVHLDSLNSIARATSSWNGLKRRIALSCLVDADHGDTARHNKEEIIVKPPETRWLERLEALDRHVSGLNQKGSDSPRNKLRQEIYQACRDADTAPSLYACDSPVGTGKTTAVMAHLLRVAAEKALRHIFVVLPYTNIIKQSVDTYRKALTLDGEYPDEIIAAHHHQADFSNIESRQLATLWSAPVIVTTAVQFFETLGSNQTSRLRKLHELAGSAVFIDETHAAIPSWLWPQTWLWLKKLSKDWRCHFIFASGSLPRFWSLPQFVKPPESIPELITEKLRKKSQDEESRRVISRRYDELLDRSGLIEFILSKDGPRIVIMNTVQSAAVIAYELREAGKSVLHLSTALTPVDRDIIVDIVRCALKTETEEDWTLVATSCVEAGIDFSFRTAFREICSTASLIQIGGRVNRHGNYPLSEVWSFRVLDPFLNSHPAFKTSQSVLDGLFDEKSVAKLSITDLITEAMRREVMRDCNDKTERIIKSERKGDYSEVNKLCRVIDADTRLVVVDRKTIRMLENGEQVSPQDLIMNSVQLWGAKIIELSLENIRGYEDIYKWTGPYDPCFLGYMKGVLPLVYASEKGLII